MSTAKQQNDDSSDSDPTVDAFDAAFSYVCHVDDTRATVAPEDADAWVSERKVLLLDDTVTTYGYVSLDDYTTASYVRTETLGDDTKFRCYGFTAANGDEIHWVDVEFVRTLANDVFGVSYDEMKTSAKTLDDEIPDAPDEVSTDKPVLFDVADSDYRVIVAPVKGPNE